jgi:hypothetical protein
MVALVPGVSSKDETNVTVGYPRFESPISTTTQPVDPTGVEPASLPQPAKIAPSGDPASATFAGCRVPITLRAQDAILLTADDGRRATAHTTAVTKTILIR